MISFCDEKLHRAKDPIRYMPSDDTSLRDLKC